MMPRGIAENQVALLGRNNWGKIIGFALGLLWGGFWGAILGLIIGNIFDKQHPFERTDLPDWKGYQAFSAYTEQTVFTMGVIVLGAKMARSDGRVSRTEIDSFKRVFNVSRIQEALIGPLFDQARLSSDGFEPYARRLAHVFSGRRAVLESILGNLFIIGTSDGSLGPSELSFLKSVAFIFGFTADDFVRIAAQAGVRLSEQEQRDPYRGPAQGQPEPPSCYAVLGVRETATAEEIKAAYRALIREHHPDKLMAQGMPHEFIASATEKMKRINAAYDEVCKLRGVV